MITARQAAFALITALWLCAAAPPHNPKGGAQRVLTVEQIVFHDSARRMTRSEFLAYDGLSFVPRA